MKHLVAILMMLATAPAFAQAVNTRAQDKVVFDKAIGDFDKALIARDSVALTHLLHSGLQYGHSNGWIESKKELIADLYNGKLIYKKITPVRESMETEGNTVAVRSSAQIDCVMDGTPLSFKLKVLQVWVWKDKRWQLFARQSVKM